MPMRSQTGARWASNTAACSSDHSGRSAQFIMLRMALSVSLRFPIFQFPWAGAQFMMTVYMKISALLYLTELLRQVLCFQVRIPAQHAQVLVPGDAGDFHDIQTLLEQPGSSLVAQVMKAQILETGPAHGAD